MIYPDETKYKGGWKNEQRNGYGEFTFADLKIYRGFWRDDLQEGEGEIELKNG